MGREFNRSTITQELPDMFIYCFSIFFGAFSSIALGKFIGISFAGIYSFLIIGFVGAVVGVITAQKIIRRENSRNNIRGIISACFSLWFGITVGLIIGVLLAQISILTIFTYKFGNPETTPWPSAAANTFLALVVAMAITCGLGMGAWFFHNTLKSRFKTDETDPINIEDAVETPPASPDQLTSTPENYRQDRLKQ